VDRDLPVTQVETLADSLSGSVSTTRLTASILTLFAAAALLIAATGLYGVLAQTVQQRTREVGIRVALGADARSVLAVVAGEGLRLVVGGMAIGLAAATIAGRTAQSMIVGVSPLDPLTYGVVVIVFLMTAAAASILPVRRALGVDPIVALRAE
jgi:ABC-type antimicrobial peptide transport system permease subunit